MSYVSGHFQVHRKGTDINPRSQRILIRRRAAAHIMHGSTVTYSTVCSNTSEGLLPLRRHQSRTWSMATISACRVAWKRERALHWHCLLHVTVFYKHKTKWAYGFFQYLMNTHFRISLAVENIFPSASSITSSMKGILVKYLKSWGTLFQLKCHREDKP